MSLFIDFFEQVIEKLQEEYSGRYTEVNVAVTGTHTHSGPGGYFQYSMYTLTNFGISSLSIDIIVEGIVQVCLVLSNLYVCI